MMDAEYASERTRVRRQRRRGRYDATAVYEVLDAGLGLCPGVVVFPEPEKRLRLEQTDRVASQARRFVRSRRSPRLRSHCHIGIPWISRGER